MHQFLQTQKRRVMTFCMALFGWAPSVFSQNYCVPMLDCTDGDLIKNFSLVGENGTNINKLGYTCSSNGYEDYTSDPAVSLFQGGTYSVSLGTNYYESDLATIWYKFVAPTSGNVKISTDYSGYSNTDTRIALFSVVDPQDFNTFNLISCDEDNGVEESYNSIIYTSNLNPGQTYYIAFDGYSTNYYGSYCISVEEITANMLSDAASCGDITGTPYGETPDYDGEISLVDGSGKLVAIVRNTAGGEVSSYSVQQALNITGIVRQDNNNKFYLDRSINIENTDNATDVEVTMFFLDSEIDELSNTVGETLTVYDLSVYHQSGSCSGIMSLGADELVPATTGSANGISWLRVTTPSFSNFFIQKATAPLSNNVVNLKGKATANGDLLHWEIADISGLQAVHLYHAAPGEGYTKVYTQTKGTMSQAGSYTNKQDLAAQNYYRLGLETFDGKITWSNIVKLSKDSSNSFKLSVVPNPATAHISVEVEGAIEKEAALALLDVSGRTLQTIKVANSKVEVDLSAYAPGVYLIKFQNGIEAKTVKVIKQ
jgi:hypothetical protein